LTSTERVDGGVFGQTIDATVPRAVVVSPVSVAVTQLGLRTLPAPKATGFHLLWPCTVAAAVLGAWQLWAPDAPNAIAASLLVRSPADSDLPPIVTVFGAVLDQESAARAALDEFVAGVGAAPTNASYVPGPYREIKRYLAGYDICSGERRPVEREAGHSYSKSEFFRRGLPADVIAELLARFADGRRQREARVLDFTPWAGAYNRVPAEATAFAHRAERFLLRQEVIVDASASEAERQAARGWLSRSWALVHAWGSGGVYPNFPDPELEDSAHAYHGVNLDRLSGVKGDVRPRERLPVRSVRTAHVVAGERAEAPGLFKRTRRPGVGHPLRTKLSTHLRLAAGCFFRP
jgi:hypothetical protein